MFFHQNRKRCRDGAPYQVAAWKTQPVEKKYRNKEGYAMTF